MAIVRSEGIKSEEITDFTSRPLFIEAPFGLLCNHESEGKISKKESWSDF